MMLPNKKIFYTIVLAAMLMGYLASVSLQHFASAAITEKLSAANSFEGHTYTISKIEKRIVLNRRAKLIKDDYLFTFDGYPKPFRTYSIPKENPDGQNFQMYIDRQFNEGDKVYALQINPAIQDEIYHWPVLGWMLDKSENMIIGIFPNGQPANPANYSSTRAVAAFGRLSETAITGIVVASLILGLLLYFKFIFLKQANAKN